MCPVPESQAHVPPGHPPGQSQLALICTGTMWADTGRAKPLVFLHSQEDSQLSDQLPVIREMFFGLWSHKKDFPW